MPKKSMRYLVPNAVTVASMFCGVLAIVRAAAGDPIAASWWIVTATVLDGIDGGIARALKAQSAFGSQLDSLSDFASFGMAPSILVLTTLGPVVSEPILLAAGLFFALMCAVRLARFNIATPNINYTGMPCPLAAGVFALVLLLCVEYDSALSTTAIPLVLLFIAFGGAMVFPWIQYRKMGRERSRSLKVFVAVVVLTCWVLIAMREMPEFLLGASGSAALLGPILAVIDKEDATTDSVPADSPPQG
jgi:CDP-diacylglycerol--serine O-phosphatidyltransferase